MIFTCLMGLLTKRGNDFEAIQGYFRLRKEPKLARNAAFYAYFGYISKTTADRGSGMVLNDSQMIFTCPKGLLTKMENDFETIQGYFYLRK